MIKKSVTLVCALTILFASPAFAYKKEAPAKSETEQTETGEAEPQQTQQEEYDYSTGGSSGLVTGGYILIAAGSAAAIAGTVIITATHKRLTGVIVDASGAALALAGTMMIVFGERSGYAVGPTINPAKSTYGLSFAANF